MSQPISRLALGGLLLLGAASRLPLLGRGFGSDDDAWRNAVAALRMRELGQYVPSRIPGFPVYEGALALTLPGGWMATNALSALAGLAAVFFLYRAARLRAPGAALALAAAFCFSAPLWVTCSQTMDYAVGLVFLLASYDALLRGRTGTGAILLALATGCRPTLGFLVAPAVVLLLVRRKSRNVMLGFLGAFAATALVVFLPVLLTPEAGTMRGEFAEHVARHHARFSDLPRLVRQSAVFLFTKPGLVVLVLGLGFGWWRRRTGTGRSAAAAGGGARTAGASAFEISAVLVLTGFFLLVPYDPAYLIPTLPLLLLLAAPRLSRGWVVALALAMASESLVTVYLDSRTAAPGRLFQEIEARRADLAETRAQAALRPSEPTVYVVGRFDVHRLLLLEPSLIATDRAWAPFYASGIALQTRDGRRAYASDLDARDRRALEAEGFAVVDLNARVGP